MEGAGPPQIEVRREFPKNDEMKETKVVSSSSIPTRGSMENIVEPGLNDMGVCMSLNKTASIMSSMLMATNTIRAAACEGECDHICGKDDKKRTISSEIFEEDAVCKSKMEHIRSRWQELLSCQAPQELAQNIAKQCHACDELIESKKSLIEEIHGELKAVDEDYQRMFRQQSKDLDMLILSMGTQVMNLHSIHIEELATVEADFMEQRKGLMQRNKTEIDSLLKSVRNTEGLVKEELTKKIEDYAKTLDNIQTEDNEDYNLLKVRLETDIQILEQHLESMAAAYQLNTEKLDYNYAVLVERDHDNYITAGQQKRKLTKQRDTLCTLKARHNDYEKRFLMQNSKLASDYEKTMRLLQDLQSKEHQLQAAHQKQYWDFVHMHHHSIAVLASKLLQADKTIHEEQLGWVWCPPPRDIYSSFDSVLCSRKKGSSNTEQIQCLSSQEPHTVSKDDSADELHEESKKLEHVDEGSVRSSQKELEVHDPKSENHCISEIENIWRSYCDLIPPKILNVWASLAVTMVGYNQLLKNRYAVI
ncbi:hypothetical protein KP509_06G083700 [Ceratopteris richardii]|uniref:Dynein regulatory complex protein 1/2 N-terminal domain-containing protein n=1 Tax=Ceratopteris richardii TaxID=49495 RepID=A0A8T2UQ87_CERRI|nr:hypothetical protein KP509_06G083700 [Ceratopteris richardii]